MKYSPSINGDNMAKQMGIYDQDKLKPSKKIASEKVKGTTIPTYGSKGQGMGKKLLSLFKRPTVIAAGIAAGTAGYAAYKKRKKKKASL